MALPVVHLLAAHKWANTVGQYVDCPEFYLGAISPDAMHIRFQGDKSQKNLFHLGNWTSLHADQVCAYWDKHFAPFDVGYGIHVLTDAQWVPRYRQRFPELIMPNGMLNTRQYYNDTTLADFALLRQEPRVTELFQLLQRAQAPQNHILLTEREIEAWRDHTLALYAQQCTCSDEILSVTWQYDLEFIQFCQQVLLEISGRYLK